LGERISNKQTLGSVSNSLELGSWG